MSTEIFDAKEARRRTRSVIMCVGVGKKVAETMQRIADEMIRVCCKKIQIALSVGYRETKMTFEELKGKWLEYRELENGFTENDECAFVDDKQNLDTIVLSYVIPDLCELGYEASRKSVHGVINILQIRW